MSRRDEILIGIGIMVAVLIGPTVILVLEFIR